MKMKLGSLELETKLEDNLLDTSLDAWTWDLGVIVFIGPLTMRIELYEEPATCIRENNGQKPSK